MTTDAEVEEPCGVWVVTRFAEENEVETRWCDRVDGPCPYPAAPATAANERLCGASPAKRLSVTYASEVVQEAHDRFIAFRDVGGEPLRSGETAVYVAIDALRACGANSGLT